MNLLSEEKSLPQKISEDIITLILEENLQLEILDWAVNKRLAASLIEPDSATLIKYFICCNVMWNLLFLSSESAYGYKPDADTWHPVRGAVHGQQWHPQSHGGSRWFLPAVFLWWSLQKEESSCWSQEPVLELQCFCCSRQWLHENLYPFVYGLHVFLISLQLHRKVWWFFFMSFLSARVAAMAAIGGSRRKRTRRSLISFCLLPIKVKPSGSSTIQGEDDPGIKKSWYYF